MAGSVLLGEDGGVRMTMSTRRQLIKMSTCRQLHEMLWGRNVDVPTIALLAEAVSGCKTNFLFHVKRISFERDVSFE
jgi:hypothetical protein